MAKFACLWIHLPTQATPFYAHLYPSRVKIKPYKWKAGVVVSVDALQQPLGPDTRGLKKQRSWKITARMQL